MSLFSGFLQKMSVFLALILQRIFDTSDLFRLYTNSLTAVCQYVLKLYIWLLYLRPV